jgi:hypothetical protein
VHISLSFGTLSTKEWMNLWKAPICTCFPAFFFCLSLYILSNLRQGSGW